VEHQNAWTQVCVGATDLTWNGLRLNPSLQSERLATTNLNHDMASTIDELFPVDSNAVQCSSVFYQVQDISTILVVCTKRLLSSNFDKGYSSTIHIISVGFILILSWTPAVRWVGYINTIKDVTEIGN
jgi:hypothetical protein